MFQHTCKGCNKVFEDKARNKQKCSACLRYRPKPPRISRYKVSPPFWRDPEAFSYVLGFAYADGSARQSALRLMSTDRQIVEDIKSRMEYSGDLKGRVDKRGFEPEQKPRII